MHLTQLLSMLAVAGGISRHRRFDRLSRTPGARCRDCRRIADSTPSRAFPCRRLLGPAWGGLGKLGRNFTPTSQMDGCAARQLAGIGPGGVEGSSPSRPSPPVGAALVPLAMAGSGRSFGGVVLLAVMPVPGFGFPGPGFLDRPLGKTRQKEIRRDLPETIDLMAISVQAGMGLEAAIELVPKRSRARWVTSSTGFSRRSSWVRAAGRRCTSSGTAPTSGSCRRLLWR